MKIQYLLGEIERGKVLTKSEASQVMYSIILGDLNDIQIAALLFGFQLRGLNTDEILGFSDALMELCTQLHLPSDAIDLCGTGGDQKNTFNISTLTSLLIATMGYPVIKHGNYGSTSITGSSQILELCGYTFSSDSKKLQTQFERFGYCYLHAPLFHKTLAKVASVRKQLKLRTIFNLLGPLSNPANPKYRFHGVNSLPLVRIYTHAFQKRGNHFAVYHTIDGYDEISLTAPFVYATHKGRRLINPREQGITLVNAQHIQNGSTAQESLHIFKRIIKGKGTEEQNTLIAYNTALSIQLYKGSEDYKNLFEHCLETIQKGEVSHFLQSIIDAQK